MKRAKEDWIEQQCTDIEYSLSRWKTKRAYQAVKQLTGEGECGGPPSVGCFWRLSSLTSGGVFQKGSWKGGT